MPFQPGNKLGKGRKKGQITKDRQMLLDKAKELGVDPFEILLRFAAGDWKGLGYDDQQKVVAYSVRGDEILDDVINPDMRLKAAGDACNFMLPKLKAIDVNVAEDSGPIVLSFSVGGVDATGKPKPERTDSAADKAV